MNSNKTKVMRLSNKEVQIIDFFRNNNSESLLSELGSYMYTNLNKDNNYINIRGLINILEDINTIDLDDLIDKNFISKEQSKYLLQCIKANKNIIITGNTRTGKNTLLNALLNYQRNTKIIVYQHFENTFKFDEDTLLKNDIIFKNIKNLNMQDIISLLDKKYNRSSFIIDEIITDEDWQGIFSALNIGSSVLGTMQIFNKASWVERFIEEIDDNIKKYAEETLYKHKFIEVNLSIKENGEKFVKEIKEV